MDVRIFLCGDIDGEVEMTLTVQTHGVKEFVSCKVMPNPALKCQSR